MATKAGGAYIEIRAEDAHLDRDLNKAQTKIGVAAGKMQGRVQTAFKLMAAAAVVAAGVIVKTSISQFAEFEVALNRLGNVSSRSIGDMRKDILGVSSTLGSVSNLTKGYYQVMSAGITETDAAMKMLKVSAKVSLESTIAQSDAVKGLAALMGSYSTEIKTATEAADLLYTIEKSGITSVGELIPLIGNLANLAKATGVNVNEMGAALAQVTTTGAGTAISVTQLQGLFVALNRQFTKLPPAIQKYGTATAAIKAMGFQNVLKELMRYTEGNATALGKMLGRQEGFLALLQLSKNNFAGYEERLGSMADKVGSFDDAWKRYEITLKAIWDTFKNTLGKQAILLGEELAPKIKDVIQSMSTWLEANQDLLALQIPMYVEKIGKGLATTVKVISFLSGLAIPGGMGLIGFALFGPVGFAIGAALGLIIGNLRDFEENFGELNRKIKSGNMEVMDSFGMLGADVAYMYESTAKASLDARRAQSADFNSLKKAATSSIADITNITKAQKKAAAIQKKVVADEVKLRKTAAKAIADAEAKANKEMTKSAVEAAVKKIKAADDYAKESTRIYERMVDEANKNSLSEYKYKEQLLQTRYKGYKQHLDSLGKENKDYANGTVLLEQWLTNEKQKLWDNEVRKHGTVVDRLALRWRDYQREGIDANRIMYDAISAGAENLRSQISDNLFKALTGDMDKLKWDWDSLWKSMVRSVTDAVARMATEAAIGTAVNWMTAIFAAKGIWNVASDEQPVIAHKGEMVVPANIAKKIRSNTEGSEYGTEFNAFSGAVNNLPSRTKTGFMQGTTDMYSRIGAVGAVATLNKSITPTQYALGMVNPTALVTSGLLGGVTGAVGAHFGIDGAPSKVGQGLGLLGYAALGSPLGPVGMALAMVGGMGLVDAVMDLMNVRDNEALFDLAEDLGTGIFGKYKGMAQAASLVDFANTLHSMETQYGFSPTPGGLADAISSIGRSPQTYGFEGYASQLGFGGFSPDPGLSYGGGGDGGGGGGFGGFGGLGSGLGSTGGWGGGGADEGGFWKYGGISRGPETGYPVTLHGDEAVVPLSGGRSIPVDMKGGGSTININGPLVSIEGGNHVFDDQFIEKLTREVRTELRNLEELRH